MPTKTERILNNLPSTFRAFPKPTALFIVADAFGNELLLAENSLAAVMMAHWVDHADRGAELIQDLACIAALYGLKPRGVEEKESKNGSGKCLALPSDESVEEFRDHLKRFIRIFIEGTVTVQGILRVAAEALNLQIADEYEQMDTWWTRDGDTIIKVAPRGDDAARLLFGVDSAEVTGQPARPASIAGRIDLSRGVDLGSSTILSVKVDASAPKQIDLAGLTALEAITNKINETLGVTVAGHDGRHLILASPTIGPDSRLEVQDVANAAATQLLGLLPRAFRGAEATRARVSGVELGGQVDLSQTRFLRLLVDGKHLAEIDCARSGDPAKTTLDDIRQAINSALGFELASHDGKRLTLTAPTAGFQGSVAFQSAAAQDARERLFGAITTFHAGRDARPAEAISVKDLNRGVDLSVRSKISVQIDAQPTVTVDCAGANPSITALDEIVASLTAQLGAGVASHDGRFLRLASPTIGPTSTLVFETLPADEDATEILFGAGSRVFQGSAATAAGFVGDADLNEKQGINLHALHFIQIGVDGGPLKVIDARSEAADRDQVTLQQIEKAINQAFDSDVASDDGKHLILTSPIAGENSSIVIEPLTTAIRQRFVTRAFTTNEAAPAAFGFLRKKAEGVAATTARVQGKTDLSRGVDLRETRLLRLIVDNLEAVEIDCAGARPRATLLDEIVDAINKAFGLNKPDAAVKVASKSADGKNLVLSSLGPGAGSRIAFEPPHAALNTLLGLKPGIFRGGDAARVTFVGTIDLSAGVDLSAADKVSLRVDEQQLEISCANLNDSAKTGLSDVVSAINLAFQKIVASHDGKHVILTSNEKGEQSQIAFSAPSEKDATEKIFGVKPPRSYKGAAATPARIEGEIILPAEIDMRAARFLRLAVNGAQPVDVDCAAGATDVAKVSLDQIVQAINQALSLTLASMDGNRLVLTTPATGAASRIDLASHEGSDARRRLLGAVEDETRGSGPAPAVITGEADLLRPINLAERSRIRLMVDGGRPIDIDIAGSAPSTTFLDEIVERINAVVPNLASAKDDHLVLTSPANGEISSLELLPVRALELIEYPPRPTTYPPDDQPPRPTRHGDDLTINNEGAAEADLIIELTAPHGADGPRFFNLTTSQCARAKTVINPGETLRLWRGADGSLQAEIIAPDGAKRPATAEQTGEAALVLPRGISQWIYMDCDGARFDHAGFNQSRFAGGVCDERGVFNISHFENTPPATENAVFASSQAPPDPPVEVRFRWAQFQPGAFVVNLPDDLPERFGGRFNQSFFADTDATVEKYGGVVTEPKADPKHWENIIGENGSKLVIAKMVDRVPLGFEAVNLPIRRPAVRKLTGGRGDVKAQIFLAEEDVPGFIRLSAKEPGAWAMPSLSPRKSPARLNSMSRSVSRAGGLKARAESRSAATGSHRSSRTC